MFTGDYKSLEGLLLAMGEGYQGIYEISPHQDTVYFWKNRRCPELEGQKKKYSEYFLEFMEEDLYFHDSTRFRTNLQLERLAEFLESGEENYQVAVRYNAENDPQRGIWMKTTVFRSPVGDQKVFLLIQDIQKSMVEYKVSAMAITDYDYVMEIDVQTRRFTVFSEKAKSPRANASYDVDYESELIRFAYAHFESDDISSLIQQMSIDVVREKLRSQEEYIVYVSMWERGQIHHKKYRFVYSDDLQKKVLMSRTDVTEQIERERIQQRKLQEAYQKAEKASCDKSEFISRMSHDIRTPLNAMLGMAIVAGMHIDDRDKIVESLNNITYSGKHLMNLIDEVLAMSRMANGKILVEKNSFSMKKELEIMINLIQGLLVEHHHTLETDFSQICHDNLIGDISHVQQIFMNLMGNSIKYTPEGGRIFFGVYEKEICTEKNLCLFEMKIQDNGIGMSQEFLEHLFEPFSRAQDTRINKIAGTGLGMSIARDLTNLLNGSLRVESTLGEGTTFLVELPFQMFW